MALPLAPGSGDWSAAQDVELTLFSKTRLCKFFLKGRCKRGKRCTWAHSEDDLAARPDFFKTQFCPTLFQAGQCTAGNGCRYAHASAELRRTNKNSTQLEEPRTFLYAQADPSPVSQHVDDFMDDDNDMWGALVCLEDQHAHDGSKHDKNDEEPPVCGGFSRVTTHDPSEVSMKHDSGLRRLFGGNGEESTQEDLGILNEFHPVFDVEEDDWEIEVPTDAVEGSLDVVPEIQVQLVVSKTFLSLRPCAGNVWQQRSRSLPPR